MQGFNQGLSASNFLTAQRTLTPLFVDALTTYYILRLNRRVAAVTRGPLSQQANSLLRTEGIASFGLSSFLIGLTLANTHLPKRRVLALAPESWKLLLAQLQALSAFGN